MQQIKRHARPTSPFPFSPLSRDEATRQRASALERLALFVMFPDENAELQRACLAGVRQEVTDHTRGGDVRCGYERRQWATS